MNTSCVEGKLKCIYAKEAIINDKSYVTGKAWTNFVSLWEETKKKLSISTLPFTALVKIVFFVLSELVTWDGKLTCSQRFSPLWKRFKSVEGVHSFLPSGLGLVNNGKLSSCKRHRKSF